MSIGIENEINDEGGSKHPLFGEVRRILDCPQSQTSEGATKK